jgi:hypothetical protein
MRQWLRSHLTYANVISTLCLFLLLGGGTAVALSGSNTVFSDDIVDNQVYSADVRNDALAGGGLGAGDLRPGSVGTSEIADNSISSSDIPLGAILSSDIAANSIFGFQITNDTVGAADIQNFDLNDEDVGQSTHVNFLGNIGSVPARSCVERAVTGLGVQGDHLLLEANSDGSDPQLSYTAEYSTSSNDAVIKVCNPTTSDINDSFTRFNLLVFNAQ